MEKYVDGVFCLFFFTSLPIILVFFRMLSRTVSSLSRMAPQTLGAVNTVSTRQYAITAPRPPTELNQKLKVTIIPGDGVGPELIYTVQDIVKQTGIPIEFEGEWFLKI